jgi:hypothetical protein
MIVSKCKHVCLLTFATLAFMACGCITGQSAEQQKTSPEKSQPTVKENDDAGRVMVKWQGLFLDDVQKSNATEAWALFTEGGWADQGQIMVLVDAKGSAKAIEVIPGGKNKEAPRALNASKWKSAEAALLKGEKLPDLVKHAYDQLSYEIVHVRKDKSGQVSVTERVLIDSAALDPKGHADYRALLAAFGSLKK